MAEALNESVTGRDGRGGRLGAIPTFRPYTPDLFGWFDDFSTTGAYDALGGISRTQVYLNFADRIPALAPQVAGVESALNSAIGALPVGNPVRAQLMERLAQLGAGRAVLDQLRKATSNSTAIRERQSRRCPGAAETPAHDGSNVLSPSERAALQCRDSDRATR
jgi:hypothetical protein